MVRESMVTICQGMHSNLGDLPLILFFYVFPKKIIIFSNMNRFKKNIHILGITRLIGTRIQ